MATLRVIGYVPLDFKLKEPSKSDTVAPDSPEIETFAPGIGWDEPSVTFPVIVVCEKEIPQKNNDKIIK